MIIEIISIGTELLQGAVQDTNATFISARLQQLGLETTFRTTVGDKKQLLASALKTAAERADLIICTGGLGPTVDDITLETAAELFGTAIIHDHATEEKVRKLYKAIGVTFTESSLRQALVPEGAELFENPRGTAPGVRYVFNDATFIFMPGVPREMTAMLDIGIEPVIAPNGVFLSRSLRLFGTGESHVQSILPDTITLSANPTFSFLPHRLELELKLTARGKSTEECEAILKAPCEEIYGLVGDYIYGEGDDSLQSVAVKRLREKGMTLGLAESCTGGLAGAKITEVPGASEVFKGSIVTYWAEAKTNLLGVPPETLKTHGAVSAETAEAMARGALEKLNCDVAAAITGNAGPTTDEAGGEPGRFHVALAFRDSSRQTIFHTRKVNRPRNDVRLLAAMATLDLINRNA